MGLGGGGGAGKRGWGCEEGVELRRGGGVGYSTGVVHAVL